MCLSGIYLELDNHDKATKNGICDECHKFYFPLKFQRNYLRSSSST